MKPFNRLASTVDHIRTHGEPGDLFAHTAAITAAVFLFAEKCSHRNRGIATGLHPGLDPHALGYRALNNHLFTYIEGLSSNLEYLAHDLGCGPVVTPF